MKICTNCNRVLRDDEATCPYCTQSTSSLDEIIEILPSDLGEADAIDIVDEIDYATATLELPMGYLDDAAMIISDTIDTAPRDEYAFPVEPEEFDENGEPSFDYIPDQELEQEGDLEIEAKEIDLSENDNQNILGKLGVSLIAILMVAIFIFTVSCLVKYMKGPTASDEQIMLNYVSGIWVSTPFIFAEDTSHSYVELFTINTDGTFVLEHLIPDTRNEKGYEDGSWEVDYHISGTIEIMVDSKCIIMKYTEFGKDFYFDRYIVSTEDNQIVLREFYDDAATKSYDVIFSRVSLKTPTEEAPAKPEAQPATTPETKPDTTPSAA